jgi:hypothetical protein
LAFEPQPSPHAQPSAQSQPGQLQLVQFSPSQLQSTHWQSGPQQQTTPSAAPELANSGVEAATAMTIIATTASNKAGMPKRDTKRDMKISSCLKR